MSSSTPDSRRRGDGQRKRKAGGASAETVESEVEDEDSSMHGQSQVSCRSKRSSRYQDHPRDIVLNINGGVNNISLDKFLDQREGRRPVGRPRPKQATRQAARCNEPEDLSLELVESQSSSDDDESESNPPAQPKRPMDRRNDQQSSERQTSKRYQPDEGYHTSGTAYRAEVSKKPSKGKAKEGMLPSEAGNPSLKPTQQVSLGKQKRPRCATDDFGGPSGTKSDIELEAYNESKDGTEEAGADISTSLVDQKNILRDEDDADDDNGIEDRDESEDDFNKLTMRISGAGNQDTEVLDVTALLDTGTTPDWISQKFFERLEKIGIEPIKLSTEEKTRQFSDFQGRSFSPTAKVRLMVQSDDFRGKNKSRLLLFFVSKRSGFDVLIGKDTIKKQHLFERSKPDTDPEGEGAHVGLHGPISKAEEAEMKKRKEKQQKRKDEQKKERDEKNEELIKEKKNAKAPRSGNDSAHLATMVIRRRNHSPPSGHSDVARQKLERKSSSSLEGTW